jgi:anti-sigma-K factor RskA
MRHVDPEVLALLALGEDAESLKDREHLADCAQCRGDLANLSRAAVVGRTTLDEGELVAPPARVWSRISAALELPADLLPSAPVTDLDVARRRRRPWMALAAAAAAAVLVVGAVTTWNLTRTPPPTVLATAALDPFPGWADAAGEAVVEREADGTRVVRLTLDAEVPADSYREVWLITSDATELVSLGTVRGASGTFAIPDGIDLDRYELVDISDEPYDGDPAHSGDSIVRGELRAVA